MLFPFKLPSAGLVVSGDRRVAHHEPAFGIGPLMPQLEPRAFQHAGETLACVFITILGMDRLAGFEPSMPTIPGNFYSLARLQMHFDPAFFMIEKSVMTPVPDDEVRLQQFV